MSRELRMVPPDWQHPVDEENPRYYDGSTRYIPKFDRPYEEALAEWEAEKVKWDEGFVRDYRTDGWKSREDVTSETFEEYHGEKPDPDSYMPSWPPETRTHYQMYESVSEGTPISPIFDTPEKLGRWLAKNRPSDGNFDQWMATIRAGGTYCSSVFVGDQHFTGVQAMEGLD